MTEHDAEFTVPLDLFVAILQRKAETDPLLRAQLDAAQWEAIAVAARQQSLRPSAAPSPIRPAVPVDVAAGEDPDPVA